MADIQTTLKKGNPKRAFDFWFFLVLGLVGILNTVSANAAAQNNNAFLGFGIIVGAVAYILNVLFGSTVAALAGVILKLILDFGIIYLVVAFFIYRKAKKVAGSN